MEAELNQSIAIAQELLAKHRAKGDTVNAQRVEILLLELKAALLLAKYPPVKCVF